MAERRMFAKTIIDSDAFLEMPISARLLYYDLGMRADDDGFVNSPKKIMRVIGATNDDMNILIMRKFIIPFDNGVVVIKHWRINNYLRKDRYNETQYIEQMACLDVDEKGNYHLKDTNGIPDGIPTVDTGKDSIYKQSNKLDCSSHLAVEQSAKKYQNIVDEWNTLSDIGIKPIRGIGKDTQREEWLRKRVRQYGEETVIDAIKEIRNSNFLQGKSKKGWTITFDWFIRPNNFPKVLEGNYRDTVATQTYGEQTSFVDDLQ